MPLTIEHDPVDQIAIVRATGTLTKEDYPHFAAHFEQLARQHGQLRILFDMTNFEGWDSGALWKEIKFDAKHFDNIQRLAAVGSKTWEQRILAFANPFTKAEVRYFDESQMTAARAWLTSSSKTAPTTPSVS